MFPYTKGLLFQNAVIVKHGDAGFAEVFRNPPASSQHILHPEKYFAKVQPFKTELPKVKLKGYAALAEGTFGELDHDILLRQYTDEATAKLSVKWRGGQYRVLEDKKRERQVLLYVSEWEDPADAAKLFSAWRSILRKKWKRFEVSSESAAEVTGRGDDGRFRLQLAGTRVTSVEGLPE
jgi:hypothetical protein